VAGKYTPTETDRAGLTLSCTDIEHSNWKGGNTEKAVAVLPQCEYHELTNALVAIILCLKNYLLKVEHK